MAQKILRLISAAAPLTRGYTVATLTTWAKVTAGLPVEWAAEEGAYAVVGFLPRDRCATVKPKAAGGDGYTLCAAPGAPRIVLKLALVQRKWLD